MWTDEELIDETEWSRSFANEDKSLYYYESKFIDGSVSISLPELMTRWPAWSDQKRHDFCSAFTCAPPEDSADIFRFLATDETDLIRSTIASCVSYFLPADESIPMINSWANASPVGQRANYIQAMAHTNHPDAHRLIEQQFEILCQHPQLMDDADWYNDIAMDLIWCIQHLLELNTPASNLRSTYLKLSQHPCGKIREKVSHWLATRFNTDYTNTEG